MGGAVNLRTGPICSVGFLLYRAVQDVWDVFECYIAGKPNKGGIKVERTPWCDTELNQDKVQPECCLSFPLFSQLVFSFLFSPHQFLLPTFVTYNLFSSSCCFFASYLPNCNSM